MNSFLKLNVLVLLALIFLGCNNNSGKTFDYGNVQGNSYQNEFLNVVLDIPKGWMLETESGSVENQTKPASEIKAVNLLIAYKQETNSEFRPNIVVVAENAASIRDVRNGADYLKRVRKNLVEGQQKISGIDDPIIKEEINKFRFYKMEIGIEMDDIKMKQTHYATMLNGFCLDIIITYTSAEQKADLERSVFSIRPLDL